MFKVTVSGDYRTSGGKHGDIVDFDNVVGIMPECNEDMVLSHVQNRYLGSWIKADKRFEARFNSRRTVYIDSIERVGGTPACNGKDIKKMGWDDLQDLAVLKNLLRIPLTHAVDLRAAREIAYLEYSKNVLGNIINTKIEGYDFGKLPEIVVEGGRPVAVEEKAQSNSDALNDLSNDDGDFTFPELKRLAKEKGISFSNKTSKKELKALVFPQA